ncbi:MAG: hypothetical protein AAF533_11915 [Acidobacteriota bacterium]
MKRDPRPSPSRPTADIATRPRAGRKLLTLLLTVGLASVGLLPVAQACQNLPQNNAAVTCNVVAQTSMASAGETIDFHYTVTVYGDPLIEPPVYTDDSWILMWFHAVSVPLHVSAELGGCTDEGNRRVGLALAVNDPQPEPFTLDDAYSPFADGPTSHSGSFSVTMPDLEGDWAVVGIVEILALSGVSFQASLSEGCVLLVPEDGDNTPTAQFTAPLASAPGGTALPFEIQVERNGYRPERPLRLVVERANPADPVDLFPIEPAAIAGEGLVITGDSATIEMTCGLHFPCFVGMSNDLHLKLLDGELVVFESKLTHGSGAGEAGVGEAPMAKVELLEIEGGSLQRGRDAEILLRLYARNPAVGAPLEDVVMTLGLPAGTELLESSLHHHDNPLDAVDPAPGDLVAAATLTHEGDLIRVEAERVDHRFIDVPSAPPIFWDLLEADLRLRIPASALWGHQLVIEGLSVDATQVGRPRSATTEPLAIPIEGAVIITPPRLGTPGRDPFRARPGETRASRRGL